MNHHSTKNFIYGLKDGILVHINDVENGLRCGCICPSCKSTLVAYNNPKNINAHHFQHTSGISCKGYYETMLHYMAKEVISELGELFVPNHEFILSDYAQSYIDSEWSKDNPKERVTPFRLKFVSIFIEVFKDRIKPDLLCLVNGKEIQIEIAVTHFMDENKLKKIKSLNATSLEIDLSSIDRNLQRSKLKDLLTNNIEIMQWFNNETIPRRRNIAIKKSKQIQDFLWNNMQERKVYGKAKKVYGCPIIEKQYDIRLGHCNRCRYLGQEEENIEPTPQEHYDNTKTLYTSTSVHCIGHMAKEFDKLLKSQKIGIGENKAFEKRCIN